MAHPLAHRRQYWRRILIATGVAMLVASLGWSGVMRPSVLVLHSQNERIPWTRGIDAGIDSVLDPKSGIRLQRVYLPGHDEKRAATQMAETRSFIARWRPDVILAVDDVAQVQVGAAYLARGTPQIVYSGIEDRERTLSSSAKPHVRGIAERTPWAIVEGALLQLAERSSVPAPAGSPPRKWRIALISDTGPAAEEEATGFASHLWQAAQPVGVWRCATMEQWQEALEEIAHKADVVVIGDYRNLARPEEVSRTSWRKIVAGAALERLRQPMTALSAYAVADGIPMGILPSPIEQGEVAAQMALQVAREGTGRATLRERHALTKDFALILNPQQMQRRQLSLGAMDAYYARISARLIGSAAP